METAYKLQPIQINIPPELNICNPLYYSIFPSKRRRFRAKWPHENTHSVLCFITHQCSGSFRPTGFILFTEVNLETSGSRNRADSIIQRHRAGDVDVVSGGFISTLFKGKFNRHEIVMQKRNFEIVTSLINSSFFSWVVLLEIIKVSCLR